MGVRVTVIVVLAILVSLGVFTNLQNVFADVNVDFHNDKIGDLSHPPLEEGKSAYWIKINGNGNARWEGVPLDDPNKISVTEFITANHGVGHTGAWNDIDRDKMALPENLPSGGKFRHLWSPFTPDDVCEGDTCDWTRTIAQMRTILDELKNEELNGKNTKLFLLGDSFGGGAATFIATEFTDVDFDLVYLVDPVGPSGDRFPVLHECGFEQFYNAHVIFGTCETICLLEELGVCVIKDIKPRVFNTNTKQLVYAAQTLEFPPADNPVLNPFQPFPSFTNPHGVPTLEIHEDCSNFTVSDCHSQMGNQATGRNKVIEIMKQMNTVPRITTGEIFVDEGSNVVYEIQAEDDATRWEKTSEMNFRFREGPDIDGADKGFPINVTPKNKEICSPPPVIICIPLSTRIGIATFQLSNIDGPSVINKEIQVEDDGFPCGECIVPSVREISKGALGLWDREIFVINVNNVPPTVEFPAEPIFNGFVITIPLHTTDPSIQDVQAGFDYEIDWGDGSVDNLHGNENPTFSHLYKLGEYQITVTTTDKDDGVSQPITTTVETPFNNFSDNIDDLINDGTLNKGQGNSFNSKISQLISSFEKAHDIPACNKAEAFINEVNGFINGEMFTAEQGQDLIEKIETEMDEAGCNSENTFSFDFESNAELNDDNPPTTNNSRHKSNELKDNSSHKAKFFNVNIGSSDSSNAQTADIVTDDDSGGGGDEHLTRPTFGLSHETFETIVDSGFQFNDQSFTINDNHHTPFSQQTVKIGEVNSFEAKIYADKRIKVQEFLFGIPNVGEAHLAELGVEVWYDYNGEIEDVKAVQKSNVIDKETIVATHEKTKCQALDIEQKCDTTNISVVFLEPLKDKVMAVKAIDYKNRYQITYLNEGVEIAGESLNPMQTYLIPSNVRDQGLIKVTQLAKYSPHWQSDDGRLFEMNSFGSFKEINKTFERFEDTGTAYTRLHSGFGGVMAYELKRATGIFDASELISELPDFIPYTSPEISDRMTEEMKNKMLEQEEIAKKIIEESKVQARW